MNSELVVKRETMCYWTVNLKKACFVLVYLLQSWSQRQPPPQNPTCPSLSSSTAGTSGRTCVFSASHRKSTPHSWHEFNCSFESVFVFQTGCCRCHKLFTVTLQVIFFCSSIAFLFKTCLDTYSLFSVLPLSDSSLTESVTVTALSEVTSEARPPASIGRTCCLCAQGAVPGCCSGWL